MKQTKFSTYWRKFLELIDISDHIDVVSASESIRDAVAFRGPNIAILFCAIMIASVGLNVNSIPVVIGAMLISPLMGPIMGFGLALGTNDTVLLWRALKNLAVMVGISILSATLYFIVSPLAMEYPTELLARTRPTIYDVLIAFFGGLAGIVETSRKNRGTVLSGVAIATALMPPLCTVGYGLATLQGTYFFGALYLFFINFTFITLATFLGSKYFGYEMVVSADAKVNRFRKWIFGILIIAIIVPSILSAISVINENNFNRSVNNFVRANKNFNRSYIYDYKIHDDAEPATVELFIAGEEPDSADYRQLYAAAEEYDLKSRQLVFHLDAAYAAPVQLDQNELVRDIFRSNDEKIALKNQQIATLTAERDSLQKLLNSYTILNEDIASELHAQYPDINHVTLALTADKQVICLIHNEKKRRLSATDISSVEAWLRVRLNIPSARVIIEN